MRYIKKSQTGLSLVELMVAMTIGLIVSGAVATIFIQSKASYSQNDEINFLQDNGRYVLNVLAHDLEVAGFFGGMAAPDTILFETDPSVDDYLIGSGNLECGKATKYINSVASWTYDATMPIGYHSSPDSSVVAFNYPCVSGFQAGSDFLSIKRVRGNPVTASLEAHKVYLYTDRSEGEFHTSTVALPSTMTAWEYYVHLYYLKDNTLKKMYLGWDDTNNRFAMYETDLAEGIEKFHIVFGIDDDNDSDTTADYYTSSPDAAELNSAVTARVYVLARGSKEMQGYTNAKSYQLGDLTINYSSNSDGYYRRVFSTAVVLRNPIMLNKFSD
jgi:type IV pilus assembly protein PilW